MTNGPTSTPAPSCPLPTMAALKMRASPSLPPQTISSQAIPTTPTATSSTTVTPILGTQKAKSRRRPASTTLMMATATVDSTSNFVGFTVSNSYTKRLQPNEMKATSGSSTVMDFSYCFYALTGGACPSTGTTDNGNVMAVVNNGDPTRSQTFTYDPLNRISVAGTVNTSGTNCWGEQYGYDPWGNLLTITFPSAQYNLSCVQPDSLNVGVSTKNQIDSPSGYLYDFSGNLQQTPNPGGATYSYDAENRITATANVNYYYNADGERVEKDNGTLYWYGASGDVLEETSLTGSLTNDYVFFAGQRIARRDASGDIFAYFGDHLGSSRKVEEIASGASSASLSYDADFYPFGRANEVVNTSDPIHKFTGKERDTESGNDYFGARYYGSSTGRFMSPDPLYLELERLVDPQQLNLYSYAKNNPLAFGDPTGLDVTCAGSRCDDYLKALQKDVSFKIAYDKNGKVVTQGDVDKKGLSKTDKALLNAIQDTKHHVTINAVGGQKDSSVFFGASHGSAHTINFDQAALLDAPANGGGMTSAELVGHETLEGYEESQGWSLQFSHDYAARMGLPGFEIGKPISAQLQAEMVIGITSEFPVQGTSVVEQIQTRYVTPIPKADFLKGKGIPAPSYPVTVEKKQ